MAKKRANGEGNIRKRKDGRWEGRYTAGYDEKTGKRLIKNVLGKTQAEVKEKLAKAVAEAGKRRCAESRRVHARHMAANVVRAIRQAAPVIFNCRILPTRHRIAYHAAYWRYSTQKADRARSAMALQRPTRAWAASRSAERETARAERLDDPRHTHRCCTTHSTARSKSA